MTGVEMGAVSGIRRGLVLIAVVAALTAGGVAQGLVGTEKSAPSSAVPGPSAAPTGDAGPRAAAAAATATATVAAATVTATDAAPPTDLTSSAFLDEALRLEKIEDAHIWYGQAYEIDYKPGTYDNPGADSPDYNLRYPNVASLGGYDDSALWTGTYLAAESFRYALAKQHLANATGADKGFWTSQKHQALARIKTFLPQYHMLANISEQWKAPPLDPNNPPQPDPPHQQGSNIVGTTGYPVFPGGEAGLLFRSCIPADANRSFNRQGSRIYGPFTWNGKDYYCDDATSRDAYAGTVFGMLTAYDFVDPTDLDVGQTNLHTQAGADLMLLTHFLATHGWSTPRPHDKYTTRNDLDSFYSPLFLYTPGARQHMILVARHVAHEQGTAEQQAEFDALWANEVATGLESEVVSSSLDTEQADDSYYKWNLGHLTGFDSLRLAKDEPQPVLNELKRGFGVMDATTGDDVNAHFETITWALTGEAPRRERAVEHLYQWQQWRGGMDANQGELHVNHYPMCVADPSACKIDTDQTGQFSNTTLHQATIDGGPSVDQTENPGPCTSADNCRAVSPIPVAQRIPTDFLWQRSPFQLSQDQNPGHQAPGFDYLLPYWMLRYYSEVGGAGIVGSFPDWPGPTYS